jgi:TatD DNase family protein
VLIDTHVHLDFHQFDRDRDAVLARAWQAGLVAIVTIGTNLETSQAAVALTEAYEQVFAAVGFHPHDAKTADDVSLAELHDLARHPKVVAIGEIGLDFYRDHSPRDVQRRVFGQQLQIAAELGKPVVIHSREAHTDTMDILYQWAAQCPAPASQPRGVLHGKKPGCPDLWSGRNGQRGFGGGRPQGLFPWKKPRPVAGVLHCFSGDLAMAQAAIKLGFFLGVDGPVTYRNARQLPAIVKDLPLDRLLIETDAPFLTPHPHRGKRNEPAYVQLVAEKIAELKNLPLQEVAQVTTANAQALFQIKVNES